MECFRGFQYAWNHFVHSMRLAFCLFAYRPYGGLQRDFYRIAQLCAERGHCIDVFTKEWQGKKPET